MTPVRVRFAPSPTGYLHVGNLRTALYDYLFARKNSGTFVLRIEDTDQKRLVADAVRNLLVTLERMCVRHDEGVFINGDNQPLIQKGAFGPYIQSQRIEIYKEHAERLIASGDAYYCFCTAGRLSALREEQVKNKQAPKYDKYCLHLTDEDVETRLKSKEPHVIRLNVPEENREIVFQDMVRGRVAIQSKDVDDQVLVKSDGFPTYHLAVVVDDHLMNITHVIRGEEWISSTPKHILLYEAFGYPVPQFAHLPLLLNPDKSKLSKRQGDVAVEDYLKKGYLEEALVNFIALLGWNPGKGSTQEIFSLDELVDAFDLGKVNKAGCVFDHKKLDWMNAEYIKKLSTDELYERAQKCGCYLNELIQNAPEERRTEAYLKKVLTVERERLVRLDQIGVQNPYFFIDAVYEPLLLRWKKNPPEMTREALLKAETLFAHLSESEWSSKEQLEKVLLEAAGEKRGDFLWPLRVALTGAERSPSPFEVAWVLGREESLKRVQKAIEILG